MPPVLSCQQIREIDRIAIHDLGIPGLVLMENAGRGASEALLANSRSHNIAANRALIACGHGNNGGDGFVIARHLDLAGLDVHVWLAGATSDLRGDAEATYKWLDASNVKVHPCGPLHSGVIGEEVKTLLATMGPTDWAIDALLGTGSQGEPRSNMSTIIEAFNRLTCRRLAIDVPTGLNADSGEASSGKTFRAHITTTFVAAKPGLVTPPSREYVGQLQVVDIGIPSRLRSRFGLTPRSKD